MPVGGLRILLSRTVLAGVSRRSLWRPAPAAHALLGSRVEKMSEPKQASGKQASIASFFGGGGQPKRAVTTSAAAGDAGAAKRSADGEAAPSGARAAILCCGAARPRRVARNGPLALASRRVFARLVCALPAPFASQLPRCRAAPGGSGRHDRSAGRLRAVCLPALFASAPLRVSAPLQRVGGLIKAKLTRICTADAVGDQDNAGAGGSKQKARSCCRLLLGRSGAAPAWGATVFAL